MKKQFFVVLMILLTTVTFAQKKEIKKAQKAIKAENYTEAISLLKQAEPLIANADNSLKMMYYIAVGQANTFQAGDDFNMMEIAKNALLNAQKLEPNTKTLINDFDNLRTTYINSAIKDQDKKNHKLASEKLFNSYSISKKDTSDLYFASTNAIKGKDYDNAIKYSQLLLDLGYTGIVKEYYSVNKNTEEKEVFQNKELRDASILTGDYILPTEKNSKSKLENVYRNMTLVYSEKGDIEKSFQFIKKARVESPNDISLIRIEAEIAYELGDLTTYDKLMKEVIILDPNNPENYFNIGAISAKLGDYDRAMENYQKAIELDKNYSSAYFNISSLILDKQVPIIDEMNGLGTSRADYDRYDVLAAKLTELQKEAIPFLENTVRLRPDDVDNMRSLLNLYSQTDEDAKFKELKNKIQTLEGGQ